MPLLSELKTFASNKEESAGCCVAAILSSVDDVLVAAEAAHFAALGGLLPSHIA